MKKKKWKKVIIISLSAILVLSVGIGILLWNVIQSSGSGSMEAADYDRRLPIWETVAGNSSKSKLDEMDIDYNSNQLFATLGFADAIVGDEYADSERTIDTFTYFHEIKNGYELETFEDDPYLIPYLSDQSNKAVIVIPGGGYGYKSMDGSAGEGKDIAEKLQDNGISAFVLHYRTNPYEAPIPQLDLQRAIRYLRYHADEFGISPDEIYALGFSAGGNLIGNHINMVRNENLFPDGYTPDEVDQMDAELCNAAMAYPALTFNYNVPMLFALFNANEVRDEAKRREFLEALDLSKNYQAEDVRQFLVYSKDDQMVKKDGTEAYIQSARAKNTDLTVVTLNNQSHGFKPELYFDQLLEWIQEDE